MKLTKTATIQNTALNSVDDVVFISPKTLATLIAKLNVTKLETFNTFMKQELLNLGKKESEAFLLNFSSYVPCLTPKPTISPKTKAKPMKHVTELPNFGEENDYWGFIEDYLPNYGSRNDVCKSNDLSKAIYDGFDENNQYLQTEYLTKHHMAAALYDLDLALYNEAIDAYNKKLEDKEVFAKKPKFKGVFVTSNPEKFETLEPSKEMPKKTPTQYRINCDAGMWYLAEANKPGVAISKKFMTSSTLYAWLINSKEYKVVKNSGINGTLIFEKIVHEKPEGKWAIVNVNNVQCGVVFIDGADCHDKLHQCISDEVNTDEDGLVDMDFVTPTPEDIDPVTLHEITMHHLNNSHTPVIVTLKQTWLYT